MSIKVSQMERVDPKSIDPLYTKEEGLIALAKIVNYSRTHKEAMNRTSDQSPFVLVEILFSILK